MAGSDQTQNTASNSQTQLPPWINQAAQQNYAFAQNVAGQPLQQYQGQMVADVAPQTQQAWDTAATGGNAGADQYNAAQAGLLGVLGQAPQQVNAGQLSSTNLAPYMNPYTQDVINATLPLMQQQNALNQNQIGNQANSANAFGGSRQGIQQGVAQAQGALNIGQMAAQLNQANFGQAMSAAQSDIGTNLQGQLANQAAQQNQGNLNLQASAGLGALGNAAEQNQVKNFGEQVTAGGMQQQQAQNEINAQMAKFQNAANYPNQQLSVLQSALGMTPYEQGQTGSSTTTTQTAMNPIATGIAAVQALGSLIPGSGSSGSNPLAAFLGGSDRSMKTDIQKVGAHPAGVPIFSYRYKGDPKSYPKVVGPMAEDVAKIAPHAVSVIPGSGGKRAVNMGVLSALAQGPVSGPRMPGPNLASIVSGGRGAAPGAMGPPIGAMGGMGGPRMPAPNLGALAGPAPGPALAGIRPRRPRGLTQPRGALAFG